MSTNEETVYDENRVNNSEETELNETVGQDQTTDAAEQTDKGGTWKKVTIGGVAGIMIGMAGTLLSGSTSAINDPDAPTTSGGGNNSGGATHAAPSVPDHVAIAEVSDDLSFSEAFAAARAEVGAGGAFVWRGGVYGTYYANEWDELTADQQSSFANQTAQATVPQQEPLAEVQQPAAEPEQPEVVDNNSANGDSPQPTATDDDVVVVSVEPEVQIVGVEQVTLDDGSTVTAGQMVIDGQDVILVDVDQDGEFDLLMADANNNGVIDEEEVVVIQGEGVMVSHLQQPDNSLQTDDLYSDLPDYANDADVNSFA